MSILFGTDGIRGKANVFPIVAEVALKTGLALGYILRQNSVQHKPRVIIGKDTRLSGYAIETSLCAGLLSSGADVFMLGPIPSPGVSFLTRSMRCDAGIMVSASHNNYLDNGIKVFSASGLKISNEMQISIENMVLSGDMTTLYCSGETMGRANRVNDVSGRYTEYIKGVFPRSESLSGMKIVIDAANGAAYKIAPEILWELGAEVISIGNDPNGLNINDECGSVKPDLVISKVKEHKADIGIALDGDADGVVICDENGNVASGDQILAALATYLKNRGKLSRLAIVATLMSNGGLKKYCNNIGLDLIISQVGDRNVCEEMQKNGINLGGERSGHIILGDYCTTGDGLMVALEILGIMRKNHTSASNVLNVFPEIPQVSDSIRYEDQLTETHLSNISKKISTMEKDLEKYGCKIVIRKSGTEPLIRLMVEANNQKIASNTMEKLLTKITDIIKQK